MDPYKVLNISRDASDDEIKKAYRKLALEHHPDKGGDENRFKQINEAYSILTDTGRRRDHEASQHFGGFGGFGGFEEIFSSFFGGSPRTKSRPQAQSDDQIMFDFKVSLEQIKRGLAQNIMFDRNKKCKSCEGVGGENKQICASCKGTGMETLRAGNMIQHSPCHSCQGEGVTFEVKCAHCAGAGVVRVQDSIALEIKEVR
jgi:molecular chaperone DnaJ